MSSLVTLYHSHMYFSFIALVQGLHSNNWDHLINMFSLVFFQLSLPQLLLSPSSSYLPFLLFSWWLPSFPFQPLLLTSLSLSFSWSPGLKAVTPRHSFNQCHWFSSGKSPTAKVCIQALLKTNSWTTVTCILTLVHSRYHSLLQTQANNINPPSHGLKYQIHKLQLYPQWHHAIALWKTEWF